MVGQWLARAGIGLYGVSYLLPALEFDLFTTGSLLGFVAFIGALGAIGDTLDGEIVWFLTWLANPLFWLAIALARRGRSERAVLVTAVALIVLVLGTLQIYEPHGIVLIARDVPFMSFPLMFGAYAWAAGIALAGVGWAIQAAATKRTPGP